MTYRAYHVILAAILAYICASLSLIWIQMMIAPPPAPEAVRFVQVADWPAGPVCPGDRLRYTALVHVTQAGALEIYPVIRRADTHPDLLALATRSPQVATALAETGAAMVGDTVIPAQAGDAFRTVFTATDTPALVGDPDAVFVVPDLPPGSYERILVAAMAHRNAREAMRVQPFEIGSDCP